MPQSTAGTAACQSTASSRTDRRLTWHLIEACLRNLGDELDRGGLERRTIVIVEGAFVGHHAAPSVPVDPERVRPRSVLPSPAEPTPVITPIPSSDPIERATGSGDEADVPQLQAGGFTVYAEERIEGNSLTAWASVGRLGSTMSDWARTDTSRVGLSHLGAARAEVPRLKCSRRAGSGLDRRQREPLICPHAGQVPQRRPCSTGTGW